MRILHSRRVDAKFNHDISSRSVPVWLAWLKYLSWFLYSNELLVINQWDGAEMDCDDPLKSRCFPTGDDVITFFGFDKANYVFDFGMLVVLAVAFRILGYLILLSKTYRKK